MATKQPFPDQPDLEEQQKNRERNQQEAEAHDKRQQEEREDEEAKARDELPDAPEQPPIGPAPATNRDPREEVPPGVPREGNMPSNETFTQYGDLPERLARAPVEWSSYGMPIQKDNQDHDPAHSVQGGLELPPDEPGMTHPERSELSDPLSPLKHHGDPYPEDDNTPVAGTGITKEDAERTIAARTKQPR